MIYEQMVELHNVAELTPMSEASGGGEPGWSGVRFQRVPEAVRVHLNENAQGRMLATSAMEIRFVADGPVRLVLSTPEPQADPWRGVILQGDFVVGHGEPITARPAAHTLAPHAAVAVLAQRLEAMDRLPVNQRPEMTFHPGVTRLLLPIGPAPVCLHAVEPGPGVTCRPPRPDELPARRLIAYGTSITHGGSASSPTLTYAAQCARRLGADLINLGSSGSCHCEPEMADYIASRDDWDVATLALSVNMQHFPAEEFRQRVAYTVDTVAAARPDKPVFAITLWPYWRDLCMIPPHVYANNPDTPEESPESIPQLANRMRQDLRDAVAESRGKGRTNLHLLEGPDLFGPFNGLTADLIHPSDYGMMEMARRLAEAIAPHLTG